MKNKNSFLRILMLALIALSWTSCHKDKDLDNKEPRVSNVEVTPAATLASFSWTVEFASQFQTGVELSEYENMADIHLVKGMKQDDKYVAVVENLTASKKYYYRIVTWNKYSSFEEEVKDFTTLSKTYTVSVSSNPEEGGAVTGGGTFTEGETCKVTATANLNYNFVNWTENGNQVSTEPEYSFTVTSDRSLVANFTAQEYTIITTADPENGGTVSGSGGYNNGDECTLTATANEGYDFMNWTKNGEEVFSNPTYTFTVTETAEYVAHFQIQSYTISVTAYPENGGTIIGAGGYNYGDECTLISAPNTGYDFIKWTKDGNSNTVSTDAELSFIVTETANYVAHFQIMNYTINVSVNPENSGSVEGGGSYDYGQTCSVYATPTEGFSFTHWTSEGDVVSTNANYTFVVTSACNLIAHFKPTAPIGAINGLFTINHNDDKVFFSQGNLQYIGSAGNGDETNTGAYWKFADNQWDYFDTITGQNSTEKTVDRDLFGWATSGYDHNFTYVHQPWSTSINNYDYLAYGSTAFNLYDQTGQADWGYNAISNGGNATNLWRTLTSDEWDFVFNTRNTSSNTRYAKAIVHGISGVILLPDDWNASYYNLYNTNLSYAPCSSNIINDSNWINRLEIHGAVFLPAAGGRGGTSVSLSGTHGSYWSASCIDESHISGVSFSGSYLNTSTSTARYVGHSVRLVYPVR